MPIIMDLVKPNALTLISDDTAAEEAPIQFAGKAKEPKSTFQNTIYSNICSGSR
ncbi:hypothetical protein PMIT1342_01825 [Prochlorococcus marinus str. MIT 1342]|nr:hypothetical protein PMIT1342_01825 [Prochlorococcus marinus str. MIT 1342]